MKKFLSILIICIVVISLIGCSDSTESQKIKITATLFPQYDFACQIGGDKVEVSLLLPAGMESHTFDPSPSDIIDISNSDLFIYTGDYMESWAGKILDGIVSPDLTVLDVSKNITLASHDHEDHDFDPHIWLNPDNANIMIDNILNALIDIDRENADYYTKNANEYKEQLNNLTKEFKDTIENAKRSTIVFCGRFSLSYFTDYYNLSYISAYDSCSSESDPSVKRIKEIMDFVNENQIPVVFYEELTDPIVARSVSEQTGAVPLLLHSCHNTSLAERAENVTFLTLMSQNLVNLRKGLN